MKLETLFGQEPNEMSSDQFKGENIILRNKFNGLVKRYNLELFQGKDGLLIASDDSGEILYKKIKDLEWFQWKPHVIDLKLQEVSKKLSELTGGYLW